MSRVVRASARRVKTIPALLAALLGGAAAAAVLAHAALAQAPASGQRAGPCEPAAGDAATGGPRVVVVVSGVRRPAGGVTVTLYGADPARFLARGGRIARLRVPLAAGAATVQACFSVSGPGTYAAAVYHDEDGDGAFGRSLVGLPTEGYGFSNDAAATLGAPAFGDVAFRAGTGTTRVPVALRY